ncbi:hypothetical protein RSOLAG22IIIB_04112 [Rhizoctonia solani]|uniref:Protein kinase domain-containing protein n=1 Tax=Rhizoctonia solani TaxID=456999 RepID=A0A0K6FV49_9AGAM|nr:hypothetical protein RSOLAG22IIIB_04112 [Rhizoctonia solani]
MASITSTEHRETISSSLQDSKCFVRDALDQLSTCQIFDNSRFSPDGWELLHHGLRSSVAKGTMRTEERTEAIIVKNIRPGPDCQSTQEAAIVVENELIIWNRLHNHANIVSFLGLANLELSLVEMRGCASHHGMAVSKYHSGGSLHQIMFNKPRGIEISTPTMRLAWVRRNEYYMYQVTRLFNSSLGLFEGFNIFTSNVMFDMDETWHAKIGDFGCSRIVCRAGCDHPGKNMATPANVAWDSPELYSPQQPARSFSSDIWTFGCLALEVQMGRLPYTGTAPRNLMWIQRRMLQGHLPATASDVYSIVENERVSKLVWSVIQQCWSLDTHARPSASNLVNQLERIQSDCTGATRDIGMVDLRLVNTSQVEH